MASMEQELLRVYVVAGGVIQKDDRFLLVQEKKESAYGLWNIPAGKVEVGETLEQAAIREVKEETGYDVRIVRKLVLQHEDGEGSVKHSYEVEIIGGGLSIPKEELLDAQWFSLRDIEGMNDKLRNKSWILDSVKAAGKK